MVILQEKQHRLLSIKLTLSIERQFNKLLKINTKFFNFTKFPKDAKPNSNNFGSTLMNHILSFTVHANFTIKIN